MADHPESIARANHVEPVPRRVRAVAAGETVIDTIDARYLWEHPHYPQFLLPPAAVADDVVEAEGDTTADEQGTWELFTLLVGGRRTPGGARRLTEDTAVDGHSGWWRVDWDAFDDWFEEDERLHGTHPRSPFVRVDALPSSRHVHVEVDGVRLAETSDAVALFETGLPTRWYLPVEDVELTHLEPTDTRTSCPYKGTVSHYWDVRIGDTHVEDAAWRYTEPLREAQPTAGRIAFLDERVDVTVDGEPTV